MVARLSSKNFKKLIFLAYFVSKHTSTCPSGMTRQLMKNPFSEAKKHSHLCNLPHITHRWLVALFPRSDVPYPKPPRCKFSKKWHRKKLHWTKALPNYRTKTTAPNRLAGKAVCLIATISPSYPLFHNELCRQPNERNRVPSKQNIFVILIFSKLKARPAQRITTLNNNIYTLKLTVPRIAPVYSAPKLFKPNIQVIIHNQPLVQAPNGPPKYHSMLYHIDISNIINHIIYTLRTNILRVKTILSNHSKSTKILA